MWTDDASHVPEGHVEIEILPQLVDRQERIRLVCVAHVGDLKRAPGAALVADARMERPDVRASQRALSDAFHDVCARSHVDEVTEAWRTLWRT